MHLIEVRFQRAMPMIGPQALLSLSYRMRSLTCPYSGCMATLISNSTIGPVLAGSCATRAATRTGAARSRTTHSIQHWSSMFQLLQKGAAEAVRLIVVNLTRMGKAAGFLRTAKVISVDLSARVPTLFHCPSLYAPVHNVGPSWQLGEKPAKAVLHVPLCVPQRKTKRNMGGLSGGR